MGVQVALLLRRPEALLVGPAASRDRGQLVQDGLGGAVSEGLAAFPGRPGHRVPFLAGGIVRAYARPGQFVTTCIA